MSDINERIVDDRIIMLLYRMVMDSKGSAPLSEVRSFGIWADPAIKAATDLRLLREGAATATLEVTPEGREVLSQALASRRTIIFGGSVPDEGPRHRTILQKIENVRHLQQGLSREDYDPILNSEDYEAVYEPRTLRFPGLRHFHTTFHWKTSRNHPLAGHTIDPRGYPGRYIVTLILRRQGAPDNPRGVQMDQGILEGDSHLRLPEEFSGKRNTEGQLQLMSIKEESHNGEPVEYLLIPNRWGRLGKIRTQLKAKNFEGANDKAYRTLLPVLCDLSYRYNVPLDILQVNTVERTTLTHAVEKVHDYQEALLPADPFDGGINYSEFPLYSTFTYLYREGLNSSSIAYGFLCFFRIIEGINKMRKRRAAQEGERRRYDNERIEGEMTSLFDEEFHGKRFGYVFEKMIPMRGKVAHAFLGGREGPETEEFDSLEKRLELEAQLSQLRSQSREMVEVMMPNEYWAPPPS